MIFILLYLPVMILSFIAGLTTKLLGAIFSGVFKFMLYLLAGMTFIVMCILAIIYSVSFHIIGLLICFFLFAKLGFAANAHRK